MLIYTCMFWNRQPNIDIDKKEYILVRIIHFVLHCITKQNL